MMTDNETELGRLLGKAFVPDPLADERHADKIDRITGDLLGRARRMAELMSHDGASVQRETEERQMLAFRVKRLRGALIELEKALKGAGRDGYGDDDLDHIEMEAFAWNLMHGGNEGGDDPEGEDDDFPREADSWRKALGGPLRQMRLRADDALKWLEPKKGKGRPRGQISASLPGSAADVTLERTALLARGSAAARTGEAAKILTKLRGLGVRKRSERPILLLLLAEAGFKAPKDPDRLMKAAEGLLPKRKRRRKSA